MIVAAAFVPQTPLLVPEIAQGAAGELDDLRIACTTAIRRASAAARQVLVVGSGSVTRAYPAGARGTFGGYGARIAVVLGSDGTAPTDLPPSLTVGAWLVREALGADARATGLSIAPGEGELVDAVVEPDLALVVVGDGSARRSTAAPGYLDERAAAFDTAVAAALGSGDPSRLRVDADLAHALLVGGADAWAAAAHLLAEHAYDAELLYDAAPYGVGYFAASWSFRG